MEQKNNVNKMTLMALILMIFTSVFGFTNIPRSFYLMGYSAIPWYIASALLFFIPYAFMMAEYGAAFKDEKGGIYSWMKISIGPRYAFIGTFMWYASYVVWMVNVSSSIWLVVSNAIFGRDLTEKLHLFGLTPTQSLGILGILLIIVITFSASKGIEKITKVTSIGGIAVALINLVLLFASIIILVLNKGALETPIASIGSAISHSPNPAYQSPIQIAGFMVFSIFAFGGIEAVAGLSDKVNNPDKNFPKGIAFAAIIIAIGYAIGIFFIGVFTDWHKVLSGDNVNMGNVAYLVMQNLGYVFGKAIGLSEVAATHLGLITSRYMGISMVLALMGAFFTLIYSPLKQLIEGTPKEMWPGKMAEQKNGMPVNAMWIQCILVVVFIALVSFGGKAAGAFFSKLILMTNVAMTIPYMFVAAAFVKFKSKKDIKRPFEVYKNKTVTLVATIVCVLTVAFANVSTILSPVMSGKNPQNTYWMIAGPLFFAIVALVMNSKYEKKMKDRVATQN